MSAPGGQADVIRGKADIQTTPDSRACPSVSASLWLAYDSQQWVVQHRVGKARRRGSDSAAMRRTGWRGVSFIGGKKATLRRVLREKGVPLTAEAQIRLDALPEQFLNFFATPASFAAQLEAEAA